MDGILPAHGQWSGRSDHSRRRALRRHPVQREDSLERLQHQRQPKRARLLPELRLDTRQGPEQHLLRCCLRRQAHRELQPLPRHHRRCSRRQLPVAKQADHLPTPLLRLCHRPRLRRTLRSRRPGADDAEHQLCSRHTNQCRQRHIHHGKRRHSICYLLRQAADCQVRHPLQGEDRRHTERHDRRHSRQRSHMDRHRHGSSHRLRCKQGKLRKRADGFRPLLSCPLTRERCARQRLQHLALQPHRTAQRADEPRQPEPRRLFDEDDRGPHQVLQRFGKEQDEQRRSLPRSTLLPVWPLPHHRC